MKCSNAKMVVELIDGSTSVDFTVVNFETGEIRTHLKVGSVEHIHMVLAEHKKSRPSGGVEFWEGDNLKGTLSPEFLDGLTETIGGVNQ